MVCRLDGWMGSDERADMHDAEHGSVEALVEQRMQSTSPILSKQIAKAWTMDIHRERHVEASL